jgi:hypothetical protein
LLIRGKPERILLLEALLINSGTVTPICSSFAVEARTPI